MNQYLQNGNLWVTQINDIPDLINIPEEVFFPRLHITTLHLNYIQMLLKIVILSIARH